MNEVFVGIDVSKSRLDVAIRPTGEVLSVDNSADGISELLRVLKEQPPALVVLEATGGMQMPLVAEMARASFPAVVM